MVEKKKVGDSEQTKQNVVEQKQKLESEVGRLKKVVEKLRQMSHEDVRRIEKDIIAKGDSLLKQAGMMIRQLGDSPSEEEMRGLKALHTMFSRNFKRVLSNIAEANRKWEHLINEEKDEDKIGAGSIVDKEKVEEQKEQKVIINNVEYDKDAGKLLCTTADGGVMPLDLAIPVFGGKPKDCTVVGNINGRAIIFVFYKSGQELTIKIDRDKVKGASLGQRGKAKTINKNPGDFRGLVKMFEGLRSHQPAAPDVVVPAEAMSKTVPAEAAPESPEVIFNTLGFRTEQEVYFKTPQGDLEPGWKIEAFDFENNGTVAVLSRTRRDAQGNIVEEHNKVDVVALQEMQTQVPAAPAEVPTVPQPEPLPVDRRTGVDLEAVKQAKLNKKIRKGEQAKNIFKKQEQKKQQVREVEKKEREEQIKKTAADFVNRPEIKKEWAVLDKDDEDAVEEWLDEYLSTMDAYEDSDKELFKQEAIAAISKSREESAREATRKMEKIMQKMLAEQKQRVAGREQELQGEAAPQEERRREVVPDDLSEQIFEQTESRRIAPGLLDEAARIFVMEKKIYKELENLDSEELRRDWLQMYFESAEGKREFYYLTGHITGLKINEGDVGKVIDAVLIGFSKEKQLLEGFKQAEKSVFEQPLREHASELYTNDFINNPEKLRWLEKTPDEFRRIALIKVFNGEKGQRELVAFDELLSGLSTAEIDDLAEKIVKKFVNNKLVESWKLIEEEEIVGGIAPLAGENLSPSRVRVGRPEVAKIPSDREGKLSTRQFIELYVVDWLARTEDDKAGRDFNQLVDEFLLEEGRGRKEFEEQTGYGWHVFPGSVEEQNQLWRELLLRELIRNNVDLADVPSVETVVEEEIKIDEEGEVEFGVLVDELSPEIKGVPPSQFIEKWSIKILGIESFSSASDDDRKIILESIFASPESLGCRSFKEMTGADFFVLFPEESERLSFVKLLEYEIKKQEREKIEENTDKFITLFTERITENFDWSNGQTYNNLGYIKLKRQLIELFSRPDVEDAFVRITGFELSRASEVLPGSVDGMMEKIIKKIYRLAGEKNPDFGALSLSTGALALTKKVQAGEATAPTPEAGRAPEARRDWSDWKGIEVGRKYSIPAGGGKIHRESGMIDFAVGSFLNSHSSVLEIAYQEVLSGSGSFNALFSLREKLKEYFSTAEGQAVFKEQFGDAFDYIVAAVQTILWEIVNEYIDAETNRGPESQAFAEAMEEQFSKELSSTKPATQAALISTADEFLRPMRGIKSYEKVEEAVLGKLSDYMRKLAPAEVADLEKEISTVLLAIKTGLTIDTPPAESTPGEAVPPAVDATPSPELASGGVSRYEEGDFSDPTSTEELLAFQDRVNSEFANPEDMIGGAVQILERIENVPEADYEKIKEAVLQMTREFTKRFYTAPEQVEVVVELAKRKMEEKEIELEPERFKALFLEKEAKEVAAMIIDQQTDVAGWKVENIKLYIFGRNPNLEQTILLNDEEEPQRYQYAYGQLFPKGEGMDEFSVQVLQRAKKLASSGWTLSEGFPRPQVEVQFETEEPEEEKIQVAENKGIVDIPSEVLHRMIGSEKLLATMKSVINIKNPEDLVSVVKDTQGIFVSTDLKKLARELAPFGYKLEDFLEEWRGKLCTDFVFSMYKMVYAERMALANKEADVFKLCSVNTALNFKDKARAMAAQFMPALVGIAVTAGGMAVVGGTVAVSLPVLGAVALGTAGSTAAGAGIAVGLRQASKYMDAYRQSLAQITKESQAKIDTRKQKSIENVQYSDKINQELEARFAMGDAGVRVASYLSENLRQGSAKTNDIKEDANAFLLKRDIMKVMEEDIARRLLLEVTEESRAEVEKNMRAEREGKVNKVIETLYSSEELTAIIEEAIMKDPKILTLFEGILAARGIDTQGVAKAIGKWKGEKQVKEEEKDVSRRKIAIVLSSALAGGTVGFLLSTSNLARGVVGSLAGGYLGMKFGHMRDIKDRREAMVMDINSTVEAAEQVLRSGETGNLLTSPIIYEDLKRKARELRLPLSLGLLDKSYREDEQTEEQTAEQKAELAGVSDLKLRAKNVLRRIEGLMIQKHMQGEVSPDSTELSGEDTRKEFEVLGEKIRSLKVGKRLESAKGLLLTEWTAHTATFAITARADGQGISRGPAEVLAQQIDKVLQLNKLEGVLGDLKGRGIKIDKTTLNTIWSGVENIKNLSVLDNVLRQAKDKVFASVSAHYPEVVSRELYRKPFKKLTPAEQVVVKDRAQSRAKETFDLLWARISPETSVVVEAKPNGKAELLLRELEADAEELGVAKEESKTELTKKAGMYKTIKYGIMGAAAGFGLGFFSQDIAAGIRSGWDWIHEAPRTVTGDLILTTRGAAGDLNMIGAQKAEAAHLAANPAERAARATAEAQRVAAEQQAEIARAASARAAEAAAVPAVPGAPKMTYNDYVTSRHLNPVEQKYLAGFINKWGPQSGLSDADTMDKILKAGEFQNGKVSVFGKEVFSGNVDTPLEAAREADMMKFQEILRHGGTGKAVEYLASRDLKGLALEKIGNPKGDPDFYKKFAEDYKAKVLDAPAGPKSPEAIKMMHRLGGALQQDENTDMYRYKQGGLFGKVKRLFFRGVDTKTPIRVLGMNELEPKSQELIVGNAREAMATIRQPRVEVAPPARPPVSAAEKLASDFAEGKAGNIIVEGNYPPGTLMNQVGQGLHRVDGNVRIDPNNIRANTDGTVAVQIGNEMVNANVVMDPVKGVPHLYPVGGRAPDFAANGQASLQSAAERIAWVNTHSPNYGGGGGGGTGRMLSPEAVKILNHGTVEKIRTGISYEQGRPATDAEVLKSPWGKAVQKLDPTFGTAPKVEVRAPDSIPTTTGAENVTETGGTLDKWRQTASDTFARQNNIVAGSKSSEALNSAMNKIDSAVRMHGDPAMINQIKAGANPADVAKIMPADLTADEKVVLGLGEKARAVTADGSKVAVQVAEGGSHLARVTMPGGGIKDVSHSSLFYARDANGDLIVKGATGVVMGRGEVVLKDGAPFIQKMTGKAS